MALYARIWCAGNIIWTFQDDATQLTSINMSVLASVAERMERQVGQEESQQKVYGYVGGWTKGRAGS